MNLGLLGWPQEELETGVSSWPLGILNLLERPVEVPPVPDYQAWYDAADTDTFELVSTNLVSRWLDKSPNGYHMSQGTTANQPIYGTRTINGIGVVDFDGIDDMLDSQCPNSSRVVTTFVVGLGDVFANSPAFGCAGSSQSGNEFRFSHSGNNLLTTIKENVAVLHAGVAVPATGVVFAVCQVLSASVIKHFRLGVAPTSASESTTFTAGTTMRLGMDSAGEQWDGTIAEVIRYATTLTDDEVTLIFDYLRLKWGI